MCRRRWIVLSALLAVGVMGCGKSESPGGTGGGPAASGTQRPAENAPVATSTDPTTVANLDAPAAAVFEFLEAMRTGDDTRATKMLTTTAQAEAARKGRTVGPTASDTARFEVGRIQYVGDDGARVACTWSDLDEDGQRQGEEALWMVRRQSEGWRIAGVAWTVFEEEPPLLLNFEDLDDALQKQQWVKEEIARRAQQAELQAQGRENSKNSVRR